MGVSWTIDQKQVIESRGCNLLVSAAAGSGKTAVLVERIIQKVTDEKHPVDIDRLVVVTFTKAAASEMRERIAAAIEKRMETEPDNAYLNRQYTLVHHAQITTIDSFCLYVVKNYFSYIDLTPGFRVGDPSELSLLENEVLEEVMESWYASEDEDFIQLLDNYATAKSDNAIVSMVKSLYNFSTSYPWPIEWLESINRAYEPHSLTAERLYKPDSWLSELMRTIHALLVGERMQLIMAGRLCEEPGGPLMYADNIRYVIEQLERLDDIEDFDALGAAIGGIDFGRLAPARGFSGDEDLKDLVTKLRNKVKADIAKLQKKYFSDKLDVQLQDLVALESNVAVLSRLTIDYANAYRRKKERLGLLDFSDIEHLALQILIDPDTKEPTKIAQEFQSQFEEIMIDEYQDSNYVQETILSAIAGGGGTFNRFMVGDVKQSIYRFRLARPELFMEKYDTYTLGESDCRKICLKQNFRSRTQVLDSVNALFSRIMKRDVGGVEYDADAALYPGASFPDSTKSDAYKTRILLAEQTNELLEAAAAGDACELEAAMIAEEITRIMEHGAVSDGAGGFRSVRYSDIVILLRSPGSWGSALSDRLSARGIPSHQVSQTGYFNTNEVQTILSLISVIDNPLQDIPLTALLRSELFHFTDEELARIRLVGEGSFFYEHLLQAAAESTELGRKCSSFYERIEGYRKMSGRMSVRELLDEIFRESGYLNVVRALPDGQRRLANVEMLLVRATDYERMSYRGLFSFIRYMNQLQKYEIDYGEADVTGEQEDVVRIMSIHKSKGLEFPIVFVSGLGRGFNKKDSEDTLILDSTYGVGLSLREGKRHRKRTTLLRELIASHIAGDNIGEELRVLYVALTRAKEQLILTGTPKKLKEKLSYYRMQSDTAATYLNRLGAECYLDWIMPAAYAHPQHFSTEYYADADFLAYEKREEKKELFDRVQLCELCKEVDEGLYERIDDRFRASYPYEEEVTLVNKLSVSEIKKRHMLFEESDEAKIADYAAEKEEPEIYLPQFLNGREATTDTDSNSGARKGTAMHRMMECFDYDALWECIKKEGTSKRVLFAELERQRDALLEKGRLKEDEAKLLYLKDIVHFLQQELVMRIMQANNNGNLFREQPFVMGVPAHKLDATWNSERLVLVQGIIDLYFEEEDGLVLLDYKTDRVTSEKELIDRYYSQIALYAAALKSATGKQVKEAFIYSFCLDAMIRIALCDQIE